MSIDQERILHAGLVSSGDLRQPANIECWPIQEKFEQYLRIAFGRGGCHLDRLHQFDPGRGHGFIDSQRRGLDILGACDPDLPIVVATTIWQYSHHLVGGLQRMRGPILLVCNWDGKWSGVVGTLNLSASLAKFGVHHSILMLDDSSPESFEAGIEEWIQTGEVKRPTPYRIEYHDSEDPIASQVAAELWRERPIMAVFDEGCMGMLNAIVDDTALGRTPFLKERISQSALVAEMQSVSDEEAAGVLDWLQGQGMSFEWGEDETGLTMEQVMSQCRMYIAATRIADDFGAAAVGIQYQQGLKDVVPASDLAEGMLNNAVRPPVFSRDGSFELYSERALPHFNEVDECAGLDAVVTNRLWTKLGLDPATTLHDIRFGDAWGDEFLWIFMISGAAPASHLVNGYQGSRGYRQRELFFPLGGSTLQGVGRPGRFVWSRVYTENSVLSADVGVGSVRQLPDEESHRRSAMTSPEWPIVHAVLDGVDRDQLLAYHRANHIQLAYVDGDIDVRQVARQKAKVFAELGLASYLCGLNED